MATLTRSALKIFIHLHLGITAVVVTKVLHEVNFIGDSYIVTILEYLVEVTCFKLMYMLSSVPFLCAFGP